MFPIIRPIFDVIYFSIMSLYIFMSSTFVILSVLEIQLFVHPCISGSLNFTEVYMWLWTYISIPFVCDFFPWILHLYVGLYCWYIHMMQLLIKVIDLFVCLRFFVPLKNFSLICRRHHDRWRAANFNLCSALTAIE